MSEDEAAICNRIKQFRGFTKCPQPLFAELLGVSKDKLASIEYGRTPLRFGMGRKLCEEFNLSRVWLAEGIGAPHSHIQFAEDIEDKIPPEMLFSEAYHLYLRPEIGADRLKQLGLGERSPMRIGFIYPLGLSKQESREWSLGQEIRAAWQGLAGASEEVRADFVRAVLVAVDQFFRRRGMERKTPGLVRVGDQSKERPPTVNQMLQMIHGKESKTGSIRSSPKSKNCAVKSEVQRLIMRVKQCASQPGAKAKLAQTLGVAPARISEWLSEEKEPSGEYAIRLLQWVEQRELGG